LGHPAVRSNFSIRGDGMNWLVEQGANLMYEVLPCRRLGQIPVRAGSQDLFHDLL
jgi:hypothetical protein